MKTRELEYSLPKELIAQSPAIPRDAARLLVVQHSGDFVDATFQDLPDLLDDKCVLVFNQTKVFKARTFATTNRGKKLEVFFLNEEEPKIWEVLVRGKVEPGDSLYFEDNLKGEIVSRSGQIKIKVNLSRATLLKFLEKYGHVPLPPYIKRPDSKDDETYYQTVFAAETGSAAAPTASLHFTKGLLSKLKKRDIKIEYITLHVGLGTFAPVNTEELEHHPIHSEYLNVTPEVAKRINAYRAAGYRIIAVGTTVVRALESSYGNGELHSFSGPTNLFIYPGYKFGIVDGIITNFHTPKSSLLGLIFAFGGKEKIKKAYSYAIAQKYRFFSYGDGMFINK